MPPTEALRHQAKRVIHKECVEDGSSAQLASRYNSLHTITTEEDRVDAPSNNAEVLKRYVGAFKRKDWEAATAFWADDVILHVQGRNPLVGDFVGKRAFLEHYGRVFADLGGTVELVEVREVLLSAQHAVALVKERAVRGQRSLDFDRVNVYHLRGGKIGEIWSYDSDPYELDEFWA
jgi:ketosteroid isomerase-like protein